MTMTTTAGAGTVFANLHARGRDLRLECQWIAPERADAPLIVFLHEGLGSVSMWKDWPTRVCDQANCRGLVYSRYGYGQSTARPLSEAWAPDFMHREAQEVLPALLEVLGVDARRDKPVLFGHSDGGSIALLYAAAYPDAVAGVVAAAPHLFVEDVSVASIAQARTAYLESDLRARLGRHHQDVDSAFWGWNDIWLNPNSAPGTSKTRWNASPVRCWRSRVSTTNTARWNRCAASAGARRKPNCWRFRTAAIRRTGISPPPLSRPSHALSTRWKNPVDPKPRTGPGVRP